MGRKDHGRADTNGGAFDSGVSSPGTDESQGAGTAITITLTGTTTGTGSPAFTSTTHGPGNFVHIASGSGCTVGWYEITSQSSGTATFDHAMGSTSNMCVGVIGGSLLTIGQANTNPTSGNTIWIKSGTYTLTTTVAVTLATLTFNGYGTTHGDNGTAPLITTATNSTVLFTSGSAGPGSNVWTDISFSNTATTRAMGIQKISNDGTGEMWSFLNDNFDGFTVAMDAHGGSGSFAVAFFSAVGVEVKNSTGNGIYLRNGFLQYGSLSGCYIHNNAQLGWTSISTGL